MPPAESWFALSLADRQALLARGAATLGRPASLLEKDVWVVWALEKLFASSSGSALVFKGGTSLSKANNLITRFSEDVDLTVDIRVLLGLGEVEEVEWLPKTRSEADRLRDRVEEALPRWIADGPVRTLEQSRIVDELEDRLRIEHAGNTVSIRYEPDGDVTSYVSPAVLLEFGGRSTGEPAVTRMISCDLAPIAAEISFPNTAARVLAPERTWWEKATAVHVFCLQGRLRSERMARHWYDLVMLDAAGIADSAMSDRSVAKSVARHKEMMFRERAVDGSVIDYHAAIGGSLVLVPEDAARTALAEDYERMLTAGLLPLDAPSFDELLLKCARLSEAANRAAGS